MQRHELFHTAGVDLARRIGAPLVLFVPALLVWQARQWSIRRPGWDGWLERHGELPALRAARLVACGTDVLAEEVVRLGVAPERVLVTPTGVDLDRFTPPPNGDAIRRNLGLDVRFVIGWVGSFRPFHVLDQLVAAAPAVPGTVLLFVGDGPERSRIEALASAAGVRAVFTGTVEPDEMPQHLAAMDVGVVLADPRSFHYSPLKVAEYLAAGLAVVAPDVEPLAGRLEPGRNSVLYPPGDSAALRSVLEQLASDADHVRSLRAGALAISARVVVGRASSSRTGGVGLERRGPIGPAGSLVLTEGVLPYSHNGPTPCIPGVTGGKTGEGAFPRTKGGKGTHDAESSFESFSAPARTQPRHKGVATSMRSNQSSDNESRGRSRAGKRQRRFGLALVVGVFIFVAAAFAPSASAQTSDSSDSTSSSSSSDSTVAHLPQTLAQLHDDV